MYIWFANHNFNESIHTNIESNILANFIETNKKFRCGLRVVIITQNKKCGHKMLWSAFWINFADIALISKIYLKCRSIENIFTLPKLNISFEYHRLLGLVKTWQILELSAISISDAICRYVGVSTTVTQNWSSVWIIKVFRITNNLCYEEQVIWGLGRIKFTPGCRRVQRGTCPG